MIILITGGSKNGKSRIAEKIAVSFDLPRFYIATMRPFGDDAREAISRHRKFREGKGFTTIERYTDIGGADFAENSVVLLECIGNLLANEMFSANGKAGCAERIIRGTDHMAKRAAALIIVTNQVGADGVQYESETMEYMKYIGEINARLAKRADCVIEAVYGIPLVLKGEIPNECY